ILGTLDYMAPEQATAPHDVGDAADVYSLGCTLYFLLTGKPPFQSGNPTQILLMHQMQKPTPLNVACPEIPAELSDLCSSMIAKQPGDRPASADHARVALSQWLQSVSAMETDLLEADGADTTEADSVFVVQVDAGASGEETPGLGAISMQETINGKLERTVSRNGFPRPDSLDRVVSRWGNLTREELLELLTSPQAREITGPGDDPNTTRRLLCGSRTFLLRFVQKADSLEDALALIDRAAKQAGAAWDDPRKGCFALQVNRFWFAVSYQDDPSREKPILNTVAPHLDSASRVCVFSDVHANWPALRVVLKEADQLGADGYLCLGDMVGYGPFPKECVDAVRNLPGPSVVLQGDHDAAVGNGARMRVSNEIETASTAWTRDNLRPEDLDWLARLPSETGSPAWLAVHGAPADPERIHEFVYEMTYRKNLDYLRDRDVQACFCGHTHVQFVHRRLADETMDKCREQEITLFAEGESAL
ncbi:MAG: metallophosphoesterase family protein, partial [Planctomycetales bacterium]